jgi:anti-anti-sigma regulatory factor
MLKITIHEGANVQTMQLEGKLSGPWVEEFAHTWDSLAASLGPKQLRVDLRGLAFVDAQGRRLLQEIYQQTNASFLVDTPLTRQFADAAMQKFLKDGEEGA